LNIIPHGTGAKHNAIVVQYVTKGNGGRTFDFFLRYDFGNDRGIFQAFFGSGSCDGNIFELMKGFRFLRREGE
jgi:hypothetical protein